MEISNLTTQQVFDLSAAVDAANLALSQYTLTFNPSAAPIADTALSSIGDFMGVARLASYSIQSRCQSGRSKSVLLTDATITAQAPNANTAGLTLYNRIALAADAEAIRVWIPNMATAAVTGVKVGIGATNAAGTWQGTPPAGAGSAGITSVTPTRSEAVATDGSTLLVATFGGKTSGTLAEGFDPTNLIGSYTPTDWMSIVTVPRIDGSATPFPLVDVLVEYPAGSVATLAFDGSAYARPSSYGNEALHGGRIWRAWMQDVLAVTTPSSFTQRNISGVYIPIIVQYRSRNKAAVTIMVNGDSIYDGTAAALPLDSFVRKAVSQVSTSARPIEYCNVSVPGASSAMISMRGQYILPLIKPCIYTFAWATPNNMSGATLTSRQTQHALGAFGAHMAMANSVNAVPLCCSFLPVATVFKSLGATDAIRRDMNVVVASRKEADPRSFYWCDLTPAIADPVFVSGQEVPLAALIAPDGVHINEAGHTAAAAKLAPVITTALPV